MAITITKPLEVQKQEFIDEVNTLAGTKILAVYPDYKQRNMTARYVELVTLNELETPEALAIKAAWDWIKSVREASNVTNNVIIQASTIVVIRQAVEAFKNSLSTM